MPIFGQNASFGSNLAVLGPKIHFLWRWSKSYGILISGNQWDTFSVLKALTNVAQSGRLRRKCATSTRKFGYLGPRIIFLFWVRNFCQQGVSPVCSGLQLSHLDHPEEKFFFQAMGHFSGLIPVFGRFGLVSLRYNTFNFGAFSTKLGGTVPAIKKWPTMTRDPVQAGITEKRPFLSLAKKWFLGKNAIFPKK